METRTAEKIADFAQQNGADVNHHEDYSGRGMYGSTTDGVVGSLSDIVAGAVAYAGDLDPGNDFEEIEELVTTFSNMRTDNMGRSDIIVY